MKKVLVVEDEEFVQELLSRYFGSSSVVLLQAFTVKQAEKLFAENPDVSIIVMDACVPGNKPTTLPLVRKIRQTFIGPMIAASSSPEYRKELLAAGCDHECQKDAVFKKVLELLGVA